MNVVTEGHAPTPDSAWKVIQSIEGGCPKADVAGNLEPGQNPDTYTFTIPEDFAPGNYTWAWTWINKIAAEPEFYMNCAPISVTAATGSTKRVKERREKYSQSPRETTSYPDLFLANIGSASNGCNTSEAVEQQIAIAFPYPGSAVSYPNGQENLFPQACDGNLRNNGNGASSATTTSSSISGGEGARPSASGGGTMSIYPVGSTTLGSVTSSTAVLETTSSSAITSVESSATVLTTTATPSTTLSTIVSSITTSSAAVATGTSTLGDSCTDGYLLCVGGTQFSTCTGGVWDAPQDLAVHTTCEGSAGVGLTIINHY